MRSPATPAALPAGASRVVERYLAVADRLLPGRITGFYVVGSTALGAYRPGRSDLDFVAVVDGRLGRAELGRLRLAQIVSGVATGGRALLGGHLALPGTCNGVFVDRHDLMCPVTAIRPIASQTGHEFRAGVGFDVNPVVWQVLAERGIAVRGDEPGSLGLDPEPGRLRAWNLANIDAYWAPWAERLLARGKPRGTTSRGIGAWGSLGVTRLHHTIATGRVISKEAAGEYALATFDPRWHPLVAEALAYWRREAPPSPSLGRQRVATTAQFVLEVARSAHDL